MMNRMFVLLLWLAISFPAASADIYRWTDEGGQVHFSDRPPPDGIEAAELVPPNVPPPPPGAGLRTGERRWLRQIEQRKRQAQDTERRAARAAERAQRAAARERRHCAALEGRIGELRARERAGYSPAQGVRLSERLRQARERYRRECR